MHEMKVDWLSFTVPFRPVGEGADYEEAEREMKTALLRALPWDTVSALLDNTLAAERGRAPYRFGRSNRNLGLFLWFGTGMTHMTVELSGRGCAFFRDNELDALLLERVAGSVTRIDVALDIETDTRPIDFTAMRRAGRQKSVQINDSTTGQTVYIGSPSSERYARVYRYSPPHPRAHLLRAEHVFRREQAKAAAHLILHFGLASVLEGCRETFGWQHPSWPRDMAQAVSLNVHPTTREEGRTLIWLIKQVAPAFERLVFDGTIADPEAFLRDYFLSRVTREVDESLLE